MVWKEEEGEKAEEMRRGRINVLDRVGVGIVEEVEEEGEGEGEEEWRRERVRREGEEKDHLG